MHRTEATALAMALAAALGCGAAGEEDSGFPADTLRIAVPEDAAERIEEAARNAGERVGEALEETGRAIEGAGTRLREEAASGDAADEAEDEGR